MTGSYKVRIWDYRARVGKTRTTYRLRWKVAGEEFSESFTTVTLVKRFQARLIRAAEEGETFDLETGLPASMMAKSTEPDARTWYEFAQEYAALKWPFASANSRNSISETMTTVTRTLATDRPGRPDAETLQRALRGWAFIPEERRPEMSVPIANALTWVADASRPLADLSDAAVMRSVLDGLALKLDGTRAAAETVRRKRSVLYGALGYAMELKEFSEHPIDAVKWTAPKVVKQVDRRAVVNPRQARELLAAVSYVGGYRRARGRRLVALFGCMYYGGMRPAEATGLKVADCTLPEEGWGLLILSGTRPTAGKQWTDSGETHDDRGLKGRAEKETRPVPIPPVLVRMLREHLELFPNAKDGRVFGNERGGVVGASTYSRAWEEARHLALTPAQVGSPLAGTPYDLRHAALSSWLNAGMDPTEVARRAGNSVEVLMSRYAKCLDGREELNNRRIERLLEGED